MNKRIKELLAQAIDKAVPETWTTLSSEQLERVYEKFAELIVRECSDVAKETRWAVPPSQEQIARGIQQHFGVEEPKGYQPTGWVCPKCGTDRTKAACPRGRGAATDGSCPMFGVAQ